MNLTDRDLGAPPRPHYEAQMYGLLGYGVWDRMTATWVHGHWFTGPDRKAKAADAARALNEQNGSRS